MSPQMDSFSLEGILIPFSVGIGRNLAEAEHALKTAKESSKEKTGYNICVYSGAPLENTSLEKKSEQVNAYLRLKETLSILPKELSENSLSDLETLLHDPKTCLLNRLGYAIKIAELQKDHDYDPSKRLIILIDGDNMHELNANYNYEYVDKYLAVSGRAITNASRKRKWNTDLGIYNELVHRKNDAAGDEFILDMDAPLEVGELIGQRFIDVIYKAQRDLSNSMQYSNL